MHRCATVVGKSSGGLFYCSAAVLPGTTDDFVWLSPQPATSNHDKYHDPGPVRTEVYQASCIHGAEPSQATHSKPLVRLIPSLHQMYSMLHPCIRYSHFTIPQCVQSV